MTAPPVVTKTHAFLAEEPMDDRERLLAFVDYVESMAQTALASQSIPADLLAHLSVGWDDPVARAAFQDIRDKIRVAEQSTLADNGLTGPQLEMKRGVLARLDAAYRRAVDTALPTDLAQVVAGLFGWRPPRPENYLLKKIFEVIRSAWNSLLDALNLGELTKEILDFICGCIQDDVERI